MLWLRTVFRILQSVKTVAAIQFYGMHCRKDIGLAWNIWLRKALYMIHFVREQNHFIDIGMAQMEITFIQLILMSLVMVMKIMYMKASNATYLLMGLVLVGITIKIGNYIIKKWLTPLFSLMQYSRLVILYFLV